MRPAFAAAFAALLIIAPVLWSGADRPAGHAPAPLLSAALSSAALSSAAWAQEDDYDGLPPGEDRDLVYAYCGACHSNRLVAQQGLSRKRWDDILVWMVEEQGMYPLEEADRTLVLDYLSTYLGEDR